MQSFLNRIPLLSENVSCKAQELEIHEMRHTLDKADSFLSQCHGGACFDSYVLMVRWEGNLRFKDDQRRFR